MSRSTIRRFFVALTLALLPSARIDAQQAVTVSGYVRSGGAPLAGAHVRVEALVIDRTTDADGRYSFLIPSTNVRGQRITVTASMFDRRNRFTPKSATIQLVGGNVIQNFELELATGAGIAAVQGDTTQRPGAAARTEVPRDVGGIVPAVGAVDLGSALAGRIPGLQVSAASTPGGSASLWYRGPRAILGSNEPLYVVDGVALNTTVYASQAQRFGLGGFDYGNPLNDLDLGDIASVQFLGRSEAAAKFGGRGANGVVFIRTKNGADGETFSVSSSVQSVRDTYTRLPQFQNRYGQGLNGAYEFFDGRGGGINDNIDQSWGPALNGQPIAQASYLESGRPDVRLWSARPDNVRDFFDRGRTINATASVQGRGDIGSFRVFGGNRDTRGITPGDDLLRRNVGGHAMFTPNPRLQVAANLSATEWKHANAPGTGFNEGNPVSQFTRMGRQVDVDSLRKHLRDGTGRPISWTYTGHNNPFAATLLDSNLARRYRIVGGGTASFAVNSWLTAVARGGTDYYRDHQLFSIASGWMGGFPAYDGAGDFSKGGSEGNEVFVQQNTASLRLDASRRSVGGARWTFSAGMDGFGTKERIRSLGVDSIRHVPSAGAPDTAKLPELLAWSAHSRQMAAFGEATVTVPNGSIRGSLRNAWTSYLPGQHAASLLPSIDGNLNLMSALDALKNNKLFSGATLRASVWRDASDPSSYLTQTLFAGRAPSGSVAPAGTSLLLVDPGLSPELTLGWEAGADLTLRARRITLGATLYNERTEGAILPLSNAALGTIVARNAGVVTNRGIEGLLTARFGNGDYGFGWDFSATAARNWNEVESLGALGDAIPLGPDNSGLRIEARRGRPLGVLTGRKLLRDPATNALMLRNGLPLPDSARGSVELGSSQPSATLGLRSTLRFRWISVAVAGDGRFGGSVYSATNRWGSFAGTLEATAFRPDSGLLVQGIDASTGRANTTHVSTQDYYHALARIQEPWVYSASFFKLRDARLTFAVPMTSTRMPFQSVSASFVARNLYTWCNAPNIDPEPVFSPYQLRGVEMGQLPATRSIGVELTITP